MGHLRHLPSLSRHRAPHLHQPQPSRGPGHLFPHCFPSFRRCPQRRHHRVPDQPRPLPPHPLHALLLRSRHLCREGLPRAALRGRDHQLCLRARLHDGQVRPPPRQVHGLLPHVPWGRRPQGCQRRCRHHQDQAHHPVRRLVPHRLQVRYQLPAPYCCPRWRSCPRPARRVHDLQHLCHRRSVLPHRPQVRPHVRQACFRPLVRR